MSKLTTYQPPFKYKNYSLPSTKPDFHYEPKGQTIEEKIAKKIEIVSDFVESLQTKFSKNGSHSVKQALDSLNNDLDSIKETLLTSPYLNEENELKTNINNIDQMKRMFDKLQTLESEDQEVKKFSKIKHVLTELEHIITPKVPPMMIEAPKKDERISQKPEALKKSKSKSNLTKGNKMEHEEINLHAPSTHNGAKKATAKKSSAKKTSAKKTSTRKAATKKAGVKKAGTRKVARKSVAKRTTAAKKTGARKTAKRTATKARAGGVRKAAKKKTASRGKAAGAKRSVKSTVARKKVGGTRTSVRRTTARTKVGGAKKATRSKARTSRSSAAKSVHAKLLAGLKKVTARPRAKTASKKSSSRKRSSKK